MLEFTKSPVVTNPNASKLAPLTSISSLEVASSDSYDLTPNEVPTPKDDITADAVKEELKVFAKAPQKSSRFKFSKKAKETFQMTPRISLYEQFKRQDEGKSVPPAHIIQADAPQPEEAMSDDVLLELLLRQMQEK